MGKIIRCCTMLAAIMFVSGMVTKSRADVTPGSVYKDFTTSIVAAPNIDKFGVCGNIITYVGGACKDGNPPTSKTLIIDDLNDAIKAEVYVSMWGGHVGTAEQKLSVNSTSLDINSTDWKPLPQPVSTPTQNLSYDRAIFYHRTLLSTVPIDISIASLKKGTNTINFWAKDQWTSGLKGYPLYWIYSYTVRVYYDSSKRTHPTGTISVFPGSDSQAFSADASYSGGIKQVDFIGYYKDFNWEGDGRFQNWHYIYSNGNLSKHIGTDTSSPYSVKWNTTWIPDQDQPMKVVARIVGNDKMCYITDAVNLTFSRNYSVKLYSSHNVPEAFAVRASLAPRTCDINISDPMTRATGAKLIVSTWGGAGEAGDTTVTVHELGINNTPIAGLPPLPPFGAVVSYISNVPDYAFDTYDIPLNILSGTNKFYIKSNTAHHAAEINWPGPVILVKYNTVSGPAFNTTNPSNSATFSMPAKYRHLGVEQKGAGKKVVAEPIKLHPDNNRYFLYKNKPTVLIGSNEHYGAVLNLDFDYDVYLDELQSKGLNYVQIFSGTYIEGAGNDWWNQGLYPLKPIGPYTNYWNIKDNTLGPDDNKFICPWKRTIDRNTYKFDLSRWDTEYFTRLKDFISKADEKGIVVSYIFFTPFWNRTHLPGDDFWKRCPMNIVNNINGVGNTASHTDTGYSSVWDLDSNGGLTPYMNDMITKVIQELNEFDNVIYFLTLEPNYNGAGPANVMSNTFDSNTIAKIRAAEISLPKKHLIIQNAVGDGYGLKVPLANVDILSWDFYEAEPDSRIGAYTFYNKPLGNTEIAYKGNDYTLHRKMAWKWIMAGGAIWNLLDLSFTQFVPDGSVEIGSCANGTQCGLTTGGPILRGQLQILKNFIHSVNFIKMTPDNSRAPAIRALVGNSSNKQYAYYLTTDGQASLTVNLVAGDYKAEWINTKTGNIDKTETFTQSATGSKTLNPPSDYVDDIALRIRSVL